MTKTTPLTDDLYAFVLDKGVRHHPVLTRLREETLTEYKEVARIQIAPEQGQLFSFLVTALGVRRALEIGTFTGYSALCIALALPDDGTLVACDVDETATAIARRFWEEAGVGHKIDLRIGTATETLQSMIHKDQTATFDFAFVDADKQPYDTYYEQCLLLLRSGGVLVLDNMFRGGAVTDPQENDTGTQAVRELAEKIHDDERVDMCLVPITDGLMLVRKR